MNNTNVGHVLFDCLATYILNGTRVYYSTDTFGFYIIDSGVKLQINQLNLGVHVP